MGPLDYYNKVGMPVFASGKPNYDGFNESDYFADEDQKRIDDFKKKYSVKSENQYA